MKTQTAKLETVRVTDDVQYANEQLEKFGIKPRALKVVDNEIMNADTYKIGHWMFQEDNTSYSTSYVEARQGAEFDEIVFFGLQYILLTGFMKRVTEEMYEQAQEILSKHVGEGFMNAEGWRAIIDDHDGFLPIRIKAVPEGTVTPTGVALIVVESTDPRFNASWAASFIETKLMRIWYTTTIATLSREMKKILFEALLKTGDPATVMQKLIDFGSRGVTCKEQSMVGGAAHLVNFDGTDNLLGNAMLMDFYMRGDEDWLPAYSIPATEHSVTTAWGKLREFFFFNKIVNEVLPKFGICSVVLDTYSTRGAIKMLGKLRKKIEENGVIVFRPDSGDPVEMTELVVRLLDEEFGSTVNEKGYKVLNPCARIIQGDGIDLATLKAILDNFEKIGYSADNIVFGSGGGLLQKVTRDTNRFAMKASHVIVDGEGRDIYKAPETDPTKASKKGILDTVRNVKTGEVRTINQYQMMDEDEVSLLETVYENGQLVRWQSLAEIRELAKVA